MANEETIEVFFDDPVPRLGARRGDVKQIPLSEYRLQGLILKRCRAVGDFLLDGAISAACAPWSAERRQAAQDAETARFQQFERALDAVRASGLMRDDLAALRDR